MKLTVLYISYTGVLEPLGTSQVVNYLKELSSNYNFILITFEKPNDFNDIKSVQKLQKELRHYHIQWKPLKYKFGGLYYLSNIYRMYRHIGTCLNQNEIQFLHCRSYMPAIIAWVLKKRDSQIKYLFDTRGFWFDEKVDIGKWKRSGLVYKFAKSLEKFLYLHASAVVMLSQKSIKIIKNDYLFKGSANVKNIHYIPTCTDLKKFTPNYDIKNRKLKIGYIGNAIGWYNFHKTAELLKIIRNVVNFDLEIYNGDQHHYIIKTLNDYGFSDEEYTLQKVSFNEIPMKMRNLDISIFFIYPYFSKSASAATKLGELMASGVPVLTNKDVGDHEYYIEKYQVGVILDIDNLESYNYEEIIAKLNKNEVKINCRNLAESKFSLKEGVNKYLEIYDNIINSQ